LGTYKHTFQGIKSETAKLDKLPHSHKEVPKQRIPRVYTKTKTPILIRYTMKGLLRSLKFSSTHLYSTVLKAYINVLTDHIIMISENQLSELLVCKLFRPLSCLKMICATIALEFTRNSYLPEQKCV